MSIVSDRFMAAIEKITANEKEVIVRKPDGTTQLIIVRVWNETVANLTLMALGTSAPEILLAVLEIFSNNFEAGDLGPGTIVGSAAYNLFTIISLCIIVIPKGQSRRIKHLRVFFVTASFSLFAYMWLYFILSVSSPKIITVWEGLITFLFFPLCVYIAYTADRRLFVFKHIERFYRVNKHGIAIGTEGYTEEKDRKRSESLKLENGQELRAKEFKDFHQLREEYLKILQSLRKKLPQIDRVHLELLAQEELMNSGPKSHAFYRLQATRRMHGGGNIIRKIAEKTQNEIKSDLEEVSIAGSEIDPPTILFDPEQYAVMENCGTLNVRVARRGDFSGFVSVDYYTEDGSAEAGSDYIEAKGTLLFTPGIDERFIKIEIIDDDVFEQDERFFIRLKNPTDGAILGTPNIATVLILDDDHGGFIQFEDDKHDMVETIGIYEIKVVRLSGARGKVRIPYWTEDGTAKGGKAYEAKRDFVTFDNNETE